MWARGGGTGWWRWLYHRRDVINLWPLIVLTHALLRRLQKSIKWIWLCYHVMMVAVYSRDALHGNHPNRSQLHWPDCSIPHLWTESQLLKIVFNKIKGPVSGGINDGKQKNSRECQGDHCKFFYQFVKCVHLRWASLQLGLSTSSSMPSSCLSLPWEVSTMEDGTAGMMRIPEQALLYSWMMWQGSIPFLWFFPFSISL